MARIRSIKPDFFTDEDLAELPYHARLFYAGLWTEADKSGRLEDRPKQLKVKIMPYDKIDVEGVLKTLAEVKTTSGKPFIVRYEANGVRYIQILEWDKHQKPHPSEKESTIPAPTTEQIQIHVKNTLNTGYETTESKTINTPPEHLICPPAVSGSLEREGKGKEGIYADFEKSALSNWNSFCDRFPVLPKIQEISGKRRDKLKKRFEKDSFRQFDKILEAIEVQEFCRGLNDRSWTVSFDWLIENDTNYLKVLEMKYADKSKEKQKMKDEELLNKLNREAGNA